jgi:hypothetical protein
VHFAINTPIMHIIPAKEIAMTGFVIFTHRIDRPGGICSTPYRGWKSKGSILLFSMLFIFEARK